MASSSYVGLMAVFAVSSSVALVALRIHNHLNSDFLEKVQLEINGEEDDDQRSKKTRKKKVRFAADVMEPSCNNEAYRKRWSRTVAKRSSMQRTLIN